jgi:hypothetical protein
MWYLLLGLVVATAVMALLTVRRVEALMSPAPVAAS